VKNMDQLPMAQPVPAPQGQPVPAPQQGQPTAAPQQGKKPFPATKAEALQFSNDILQVIYDERTHGGIVKQLSDVDEQAGIGNGVGIIAGNLVGNRVADVRGQTGRKLEMKLVVDGTKAVITELGEIADGEGLFTMSPEDRKQALITSINILDQMGSKKQPQGQAVPVPPQQQGVQ
jgi:hypothetical protein